MIDNNNCGNCAFWHKTNHFDVGECRRHSPESSATLRYQSTDALPKWPITNTRDWCGDHNTGPAVPRGGADPNE